MTYVGRFAPSPTGALHVGSLTTAVASFLHAKQASGEWLVRIEDIDPPREVAGAADQILRTLEAFALPWDRSVLYQSQRLDVYREAADSLVRSGQAFLCSCTRGILRATAKARTGRYPGTCRTILRHERATAIRARVEPGAHPYVDGLQGLKSDDVSATLGDYVIYRRDGLPAYHLAVVVDDAAQGVTTVVRGIDLLPSTAAHVHLQNALRVATPKYFHLPVVVNAAGQKLSKQSKAEPVQIIAAPALAVRVLEYLVGSVPLELHGDSPGRLWDWAIEHWRIDRLRGQSMLGK
jgi:glutamyl-Q tRNA(Asp) synthetase